MSCTVYKIFVIPLFGAQSWSVNSSGPAGVIKLSFPTLQVQCSVFWQSNFCNISGGPSKIPTMPAPWIAGPVAWLGLGRGNLRQSRRCATWWFSGFSFRPAFWLSGWPSPNRTHWRDRPTHQEWPQFKARPQGTETSQVSAPDGRGVWSLPSVFSKKTTSQGPSHSGETLW